MVMMATPCSATDQQQLDSVEQWFENCSGAQQAVIAVRLLSRADPRAAHLIHNFLHQRLLVASAIWRLEIQQANDPGESRILYLSFSLSRDFSMCVGHILRHCRRCCE